MALTDPAKRGPVALGVRDASNRPIPEIVSRGEAEKIGPTVPRGFLSVLDYDRVPARPIPADRSGRLSWRFG